LKSHQIERRNSVKVDPGNHWGSNSDLDHRVGKGRKQVVLAGHAFPRRIKVTAGDEWFTAKEEIPAAPAR
jgi:hypothetical protein